MRKFWIIILFFASVSLLRAQNYCSGWRAEFIEGSVSPGYSQLECLMDVKFYFLDLNVNDTTTDLSGSASIHFEILADSDSMALELGDNARVDSVFLNGKFMESFSHESGLVKIFGKNLFKSDSNYVATIFYHAGPATGKGLFQGVTSREAPYYGNHVTWTLSEPFQAKNWFPCKQHLQDKADSVWVFLTTPPGKMAGSNGLLTQISEAGEDKKRYEWKSSYPIAYYLISFAVSDYIDYSFYAGNGGESDSLLVQNFIYDHPEILAREKDRIDETAEMLSFFAEIFGDYPFSQEKYGHSMAPMGGGMEHQTMTTLVNFTYELVAHELAHQWFGNNVTCGSWRDIWINEGFASYSEYLALEALKSSEMAREWMEGAHSLALNYPEESIYLSEEEAKITGRIFNYGLSYKKGASILHMLRYEINDDAQFYNILKDFQVRFHDSTATAEDYLVIVNNITGEDYSWFFEQWYYGKGYPVFQTKWRQTGDSLFFEVTQFSSSEKQELFRTHMEYRVLFENGLDTLIKVNVTENLQEFTFHMDKRISSIIVDPREWVLMKHTMFRYFPDSVFYELSPNPFIDNLRILFKDYRKETQIYVADTRGSILLKKKISGKSAELNLSSLQAGIYLLVIIDEKGERYATRIVKLDED